MLFFRRSYPVYRQHSEEDCGAACIAAIAKYHGYSLRMPVIRDAVGTSQYGTTLLGLQRGTETLGFYSRPVQSNAKILSRIDELPIPSILHWRGNHWVVFYGRRGKKFVIMDPSVGVRFLSRAEFRAGWSDWVALLLDPDPAQLSHQSSGDPPKLQQFFHRIWFHRSLLGEVLLINMLLGVLSLSTPFLIQILTDDVLVRQDLGLLNTLAIAISVLLVLSSSLGWVQANLIIHFSKRLELSLVYEFGRKLLHLPLKYFEDHRSGEILSRLQDVQIIYQLMAQVAIGLPGQIFISLVSLVFMVLYSPGLTGIALVISVLMSVSTVAFLPTLQQRTREVLALDAENQGVLVETFKGAMTLKTLAATTQFWEELQERLGRFANLTFRTSQIGIINGTFSGVVSGVGGIVLLWFGSQVVISGDMSIGQLLAFNSMNRNFMGLVGTAIALIDEWARVQAATQRLADVTEAPLEVPLDAPKTWVTLPDNVGISCHHLSFFYSGQMTFIKELSAVMPGGRVTAIMGESGCGKSTLVKLLAGLYPLQSGNIRIGDYNLSDLPLDCVRQQVVLVPQEAHFWSRSILENFRIGYPDAAFEDIVRVCQVVEADQFISHLPQTYHTVLGEFGANLSGGQRQRLAIARALLHNPPVLLLDEATSGLDQDSEARVLPNLLAYRRGKTTVIISHRPSVLHYADWLIRLKNGTVINQHPVRQHATTAEQEPRSPHSHPGQSGQSRRRSKAQQTAASDKTTHGTPNGAVNGGGDRSISVEPSPTLADMVQWSNRSRNNTFM